MATFIAKKIIEAAELSMEKGQAKYRGYFIKTKLYAKYKEDADTILETEGYGECIVTE